LSSLIISLGFMFIMFGILFELIQRK
jgi:hypothetical protein